MFVRLVGVEDVVLSDPNEEVAGRDILDTVGRGDNPGVRDKSRPAFVLELSRLVLSERHLPRPLRIAGNVPAHDTGRPEELPPADLAVVRVGVERVE